MKEGWEIKKLGEVCIRLTDGSHNPPKGIQHSNYVMLSSQNIFNDKVIYDDVRFLQEADFLREDKRTCVQEGDILLTIVGTIGRCAVFTGSKNVTLQRSVAVLRPQENVLSRYLMYCLIGKNASLNEEAHGIAQKGIYLKQLSQVIIPIPSIAEQEKIVAELDCLSGIIEKKKQQLKEYDALAQSIFYEMFGDPVENEKGWEIKSIGDVCSFSQGVQIDVPLQSTESKEGWSRFLRIVDYTTCNTDIRFVEVSNEKYFVKLDDVVVVRYGASAGFVGIDKEGVLANNLFKLNHDRHILNYKYLYYLLSTDYYKSFIKDVAFGAAMPALSFSSFKMFRIFIPPLALQQEFASKIEAIEKQKALIKKSIEEVETLFNSRMDYYFN